MCTKSYVKTPVGDVKVGDVVCFFRTATIVKFGTVAIIKPDNKIFIKQCFGVKYSEDNKQSIYQLLSRNINTHDVKEIL